MSDYPLRRPLKMLRKPLEEAPVQAPDADLGHSVIKVARKLKKMPTPDLLPSVALPVKGEEESSSDEEAAPVAVPARRKLKAAQPAREEAPDASTLPMPPPEMLREKAPAPAPEPAKKKKTFPYDYIPKVSEFLEVSPDERQSVLFQKIQELKDLASTSRLSGVKMLLDAKILPLIEAMDYPPGGAQELYDETLDELKELVPQNASRPSLEETEQRLKAQLATALKQDTELRKKVLDVFGGEKKEKKEPQRRRGTPISNKEELVEFVKRFVSQGRIHESVLEQVKNKDWDFSRGIYIKMGPKNLILSYSK
jgi:hypothetical protein